MSVYKRGRVYWYKFTYRGEPIRETTRQGNKRVAEQMEAAHKTILAKAEVGIEERAPAPTLAQFATRFMDTIRVQCASKPQTIRFYDQKLARLLESPLATRRLNQIEEEAIEVYKQGRQVQPRETASKKLAPATVNRELATLRRLLRLAHEWKVIDRVPRIRMLRGERCREYVLPHKMEATYLTALPEPTASVALFLLDTGLRIGEALTLDWDDVRMEPTGEAHYGHLTVRSRNSKNSKSRHVLLSQRVRALLQGLNPNAEGLVFRQDNGAPLAVTHLDHQHSRIRAILKLPADFVLHSLRHTFGTRLGEAGADVFTIMKLMGHSSVTVSQRYVHPSSETLERAFWRMERLNQAQGASQSGVGAELGTAFERSAKFVQ